MFASWSLAATQLAVLLAGVAVTLWPPDNDRAKQLWLVLFLVLGGINVAFAVRQAIEGSRQSDEIARGVRSVQEQTKQPPQIHVTVPPPVVHIFPMPAQAALLASPEMSTPGQAADAEKLSPAELRLQLYTSLNQLQRQGYGLLEMFGRVREEEPLYDMYASEWKGMIEGLLAEAGRSHDVAAFNKTEGIPPVTFPPTVIPDIMASTVTFGHDCIG